MTLNPQWPHWPRQHHMDSTPRGGSYLGSPATPRSCSFLSSIGYPICNRTNCWQSRRPFEQNEFSDQILQGSFNINLLTSSVEVQDIVKSMSYQDTSNPLEFDCTITVNQLKEQFKVAKESTASSRNGLHYGHWKILLQDDNGLFPYASMICFAFKWGVPTKAWEMVVQPVLKKDQGSPKITRLWWIVLFNATMNMGFRIIFGHCMMKMATKMGILFPYQFGSRSRHSALGCVLLKWLSYDMACLLITLLCVFDCDATACFNQMIPSQCMTLGRQTGVQAGPVRLHLRISENMKYHIKIAYGVSLGHFVTSFFLLILGLMQGSAAAGAFWALSSSLLLAMLQQCHKPTRFPSPRAHVYTAQNGKANINDMALWKLTMTGTISTLVQSMNVMAQTWERLLWVLGGGLNLKKCYWFAVSWKWTKTGEPSMEMILDNPDLEIWLTQGSNHASTLPITHVEVTKGTCTIGARLCPSRSDKAKLLYRIEHRKKLHQCLQQAPTNKEEMHLGFWNVLTGSRICTSDEMFRPNPVTVQWLVNILWQHSSESLELPAKGFGNKWHWLPRWCHQILRTY